MKRLLPLLLIAFLLFSSFTSSASHMMGADIQWKCIGQDTFKVSIYVYRDCQGVNLSNTAMTFSAGSNCQINKVGSQSLSLERDITPVCPGSCSQCDKTTGCSFNYGIQLYQLTQIIDVSAFTGSCCKMQIDWATCCRNTALTTVKFSEPNFKTSAEVDFCVAPNDNSPIFHADPFMFACIGKDFIYSQGAVDVDVDSLGVPLDSLYYQLTEPMQGTSAPIEFLPGYSYDKPIKYLGNPKTYSINDFPYGFHLDETSGDVLFRGTRAEQSIIAFDVHMYRKGKYVGFVRRDLEIIIAKCNSNNPPEISGIDCSSNYNQSNFRVPVCTDDEVCFNVCVTDRDLKNELSVQYKSNVPGAVISIDSSQKNNVKLHFCWEVEKKFMGKGPFTLWVSATDDNCPNIASTSRTFQLYVGDTSPYQIDRTVRLKDSTCGTYEFIAITKDSVSQWDWEWYVFDSIQIRSVNTEAFADTFSYAFDSTGVYPIKLVTRRDGCWHAFYDTISVTRSGYIQLPQLKDTTLCADRTLKRSFSASGPYALKQHSWYTDLDSGNNQNIDVDLKKKGMYWVRYKATDVKGCELEKTFKVRVKDRTTSDILKNSVVCDTQATIKLPYYQGDTALSVWSGPGVIGSEFISAKAGFGDHTLSYVYEKPDYCVVDQATFKVRQLPVVDLGADRYACQNSPSITLNPQPAGGTLYGDTGFLTNQLEFNCTNLSAGTYKFYYRRVDFDGCVNTDTAHITLTQYLPKVDIGRDRIACLYNEPIQIQAAPPGGTFGSSYVDTLGQFLPSLAGFGKHEIPYHYVDSAHCSNWDTMIVDVRNYRPHVQANSDSSFCDRPGLLFLNEGIPIGGTWEGTNVITSTDSQFYDISKATKDQDQQLYYYWADSNGCFNYDTMVVRVKSIPKVNAGKDFSYCAGPDTTLQLDGGVPKGGTWTGNNVSNNSVFIDPTMIGDNYELKYVYLDSNGCSGMDSARLSVFGLPTVKIFEPDTQCILGTSSYGLWADSSGGTWSGVPTQKVGKDSSYAVLDKSMLGTNQIFYTYQDQMGCEATKSTYLSIGSTPWASFLASTKSGHKPLKVDFTNISNYAKSWVWDFGDGNTSTAFEPSHVFTDTGIFTVGLTAFDTSGWCSAQYFDTISVTDSSTNAIGRVEIPGVQLFPNPAHTAVQMRNLTGRALHYEVMDLRGKRVLEGTARTQVSTLDIAELPAGVYPVRLYGTGYMQTTYLIVD